MMSLNTTVILLYFSLIKIVCVTCMTECEEELLEEFDNDQPLDDFLHAFLNIKYDRVFWDTNTNINEPIYRGKGELKKSARDYYNDLFNIALDMGIPEILSPQNYCRTEHEGEEDACTSAIAAIGCRANFPGPNCFEKMYYGWRMSSELDNATPGTERLSTDELLMAIEKGSYDFCYLSDDELFQAFSNRTDLMHELSDENLLREYFRRLYEENHVFWEGHPKNPYGTYQLRDDDFYGMSAFNEFKRVHFPNVEHPEMRQHYDNEMLLRARIRSYGISKLPFKAICEEYQRRKSLPKFYDNLYAMDMCKKIRNSTWDTSNFMNREDFCEKYISEQELKYQQ